MSFRTYVYFSYFFFGGALATNTAYSPMRLTVSPHSNKLY